MTFDLSNIDILLPPFLSSIDKGRLKEGLKQFKNENTDWSQGYNTNFFLNKENNYFLQADILTEIRYPYWNISNLSYDKKYCDAIILSTTCDIEADSKTRKIDKQVLFAPLVEYKLYIEDLKEKIPMKSVIATEKAIKLQEYSNLFYIPENSSNQKDYIALLDQIFWFPTSELNTYTINIQQNRIASLDYFGFYLFILKLSYHLCRLPEDQHRT